MAASGENLGLLLGLQEVKFPAPSTSSGQALSQKARQGWGNRTCDDAERLGQVPRIEFRAAHPFAKKRERMGHPQSW